MKKILLRMLPLLVSTYSYAQFTTPTAGKTVTTDNVGIGTTNVNNSFTVVGSNNGGYPGNTATFSSNLGASTSTGNQVNITYSENIWGLLLGCDGSGVSTSYYHSPNAAYVINVANAPLYLGSNNAAKMAIIPNGNVGIGTTLPNVPLQIAKTGNNVTGDMTLLSTFTDPTGVKGISLGYNEHSQAGIIYSENNTGIGSPLEFWTYSGGIFAARMTFTQNGNLAIGTTDPGEYKLAVKGVIHSQAVQVDMNSWNDYVFDKDYDLTSLTDVKTYIDQNHHLPEIPSAGQVAKEGINLGEMNAKLLKKIEELTLYLIEKDDQSIKQQNQINEQKINNNKLQQQINELKEQFTRLITSQKK